MTQATLTIGLTNSGDLELVLPGLNDQPDWRVMLPSDPAKAMATVYRILAARNKQLNRIGFDGAPTQAIAQEWLRNSSKVSDSPLKRVAAKARVRDFRGDGSVEVRTIPAKTKGKRVAKISPDTSKTLEECGL